MDYQISWTSNHIVMDASRDALMTRLSEQYNFSVIDATFASFLATHKSAVLAHFARVSHTVPKTDIFSLAYYSHDKIVYGATSEVTVSPDHERRLWKNLNLRVCNGGFLYKPRNELQLHDNKTYDHHNATNWVLLDRFEVNKLTSVVALAAEILGGNPNCRVYYNEDVQRIDLKFIDPSILCSVNVSFEPGYALQDFDDDADWY